MLEFPDEEISEDRQKFLDRFRRVFKKPSKKRGFSRILRILGPGVITGAADDDPSGIATYSQA